MKESKDINIARKDRGSKRNGKNQQNVHKNKSTSGKKAVNNSTVKEKILIYKPRKFMLMKTGVSWMEQAFFNDPKTFPSANDKFVEECRTHAAKIIEDDAALYQKRKQGTKSNDVWMKTVVSSGTLADKIAALTVMIEDAPIHTLTLMDSLMAMVKKKGRRECLMALDNIKDLFLSSWLPSDRKLHHFEEHPISMLDQLCSGNRDSEDRRLVIWYFEDQLKKKYSDFVNCLQNLSHDSLTAAKTKAIGASFDLLISKPEQEKTLLMILVNKLGDPDHRIAAKCAHLLGSLVDKHPNMKSIVMLEVERLLYRPNIAKKAQYYAVCFLNQLVLNHEEADLAGRLISAYFSFFKSYVKTGDVDSKMMSALLTGVNRSYPYAKDDDNKLEENMKTLYKVVHIVNFNTSIQALMLIYQVMKASTTLTDRYYMSLYRKLADPAVLHSSKQTMFLNLLFKSMSTDTSTKRIKAFVKRTLQVANSQWSSFACSALVLVSEVLKAHPRLLTTCGFVEDSDDEEHFEDISDDDDDDVKHKNITNEKTADEHRSEKTVTPCHSWVHRTSSRAEGKPEKRYYDPYDRNPQYSLAETDFVWELYKLAGHYHPTVALFANNILDGKNIDYSGDPLHDFTQMRFLDRFVYRNPKQNIPATKSVQSKKQIYEPKGARAIPVNSGLYSSQDEKQIPVDERFFYRYFSRKKKEELNESDVESVDDDEFDDYLDKHAEQEPGGANVTFDFAGEFSGRGRAKAAKKGSEESSEDDASDGREEDSDEEEVSDDGEMFGAGGDEEDELSDEEVDFKDEDFGDEFDDDENLDVDGKKVKKRKGVSGGFGEPVRKRGRKDMSDLFVAAEEFSHLLSEDTSSKLNISGDQAMSNVKDNAGVKQLQWEIKRNEWIQDKDWKSKRRNKTKGKQTRVRRKK